MIHESSLLVAQISSTAASVIGLVAFVYACAAFSKLTTGRLRDAILRTALFTLVIVLGVSSMTFYHLTQNTAHEDVSELVENFWYVFMFTAFILSCFESFSIIQVGRFLEEVDMKTRDMHVKRK